MARRRFWGAIVVTALAVACGGKGTSPAKEPDPGGAAGPREALLELLKPDAKTVLPPPAWTRAVLFPNGYEQKQLVELLNTRRSDIGVVQAAGMGMSLEHDIATGAKCDLDCKRALLNAYLIIRAHVMVGRGFLNSSLDAAEMWSAVKPERLAEIKAYNARLLEAMAARSRALAIDLIEGAPAAPTTTETLLGLANVELTIPAYEIAAALARYAVSPAAAGAGDLLEAAELCYQSKNLTCGDRSLVRARQATAGRDAIKPERWTELDKTRTSAHRAAALDGVTTDAGLRELAPLLVELRRTSEAETLYTSLMRAHPADAQMALGLARIQRTRQMSDEPAKTILAAGRENRDRAFYQVAAGVLAHHAFRLITQKPEAVAAIEPQIRGVLREFAAHEPDRAELLLIALDLVLELANSKAPKESKEDWVNSPELQKAVSRIDAAQKRYPKSESLARMALFLSILDKDEARRKTTVARIARGFAADAELALLIRNATVLLGDDGIASVIEKLGLVASPTDEQAVAIIDLTASQTEPGKVEAWTNIARAYMEKLQGDDKQPDPRLLSNYGTALYNAGAKDEARAVWAKAIELGADHAVPAINLYATGPEQRDELWAYIEHKLDSDRNDTRRLARRWKIHVTVTDPKERKKQLADLDAEPRARIGRGTDNAVMSIKYELGVGYSSSEDLLINADLGVALWLVLRPDKPKP